MISWWITFIHSHPLPSPHSHSLSFSLSPSLSGLPFPAILVWVYSTPGSICNNKQPRSHPRPHFHSQKTTMAVTLYKQHLHCVYHGLSLPCKTSGSCSPGALWPLKGIAFHSILHVWCHPNSAEQPAVPSNYSWEFYLTSEGWFKWKSHQPTPFLPTCQLSFQSQTVSEIDRVGIICCYLTDEESEIFWFQVHFPFISPGIRTYFIGTEALVKCSRDQVRRLYLEGWLHRYTL